MSTSTSTIQIFEHERENPRIWDGCLGCFVAFHNRYDLGDEHGYNKNNYSSWQEICADIEKREKPIVILPVYMLDHSGLQFSVGSSFYGKVNSDYALFDSGQVGFIFTTHERIRELMGWTRITATRREWIIKTLAHEIEVEYEKYINGCPEYTFLATYENAEGKTVEYYSDEIFDFPDDALESAQTFLIHKTGHYGKRIK